MPEFEAKLVRPEATGSWTYLTVPFDAARMYGTEARVQVKGTINGIPYQGTLMPHGDGRHFMVVNKELRDMAKVQPGDTVKVVMEQDPEQRTVQAPEDFLLALQSNEAANAIYDKLSYAYQKEYVAWIEAAKRADTRVSRIHKAVDKLADGKKLK